jgi:hypothetical protein
LPALGDSAVATDRAAPELRRGVVSGSAGRDCPGDAVGRGAAGRRVVGAGRGAATVRDWAARGDVPGTVRDCPARGCFARGWAARCGGSCGVSAACDLVSPCLPRRWRGTGAERSGVPVFALPPTAPSRVAALPRVIVSVIPGAALVVRHS